MLIHVHILKCVFTNNYTNIYRNAKYIILKHIHFGPHINT